MQTLRLLNAVAFLLLFTPFFQMCSGDEEDVTRGIEAPLDNGSADREVAPSTAQFDPSGEEKTTLESFWELITIPGDNFTTTAFGLLVTTLFDIREGHFSDIWIGSIFTIISFILTTVMLILLLRGHPDRYIRLTQANLVFILSAFVAAIFTFDSVSQVKWGYYSYLAAMVAILWKARREFVRTT